ncbi:LacI family DNA-binding transcriptional regulator [Dactylosporangium sp. NPDC049140]|uniref:LacI family DNA-binding transcriptional regulator n=1 Tax=Dactylosporangium sp. NPDC049140 TaxID=3155647 RepID=UPI0033CE6F74
MSERGSGAVSKVGIREVARHAGVALGTVSHYLNHPERVSEQKAERIRLAIEELGFVPNIVGRQLRLGESNAIAYIAPDFSNPFFFTLVEGVEARAAEHGLAVFVVNAHGNREREDQYIGLFERYRVRGMLVASFERLEDRLAEVRRRGTPNVLIGGRAVSDKQPSVSVDEVVGGRLAGEHLLSLGRRRLAFVGGPLSIQQVAGRLQGASLAVREAGSATLEVVDIPERTIRAGRAVGHRILARDPALRPDAVFAVNDLLAIGILHAFVMGGVRIPEDIAVIGYDDIEYAESSIVPLSSIRTPHEDFGSVAVDLLLNNIESGAVRHEVFTPKLVIRSSTSGPAPA